MQEERGAVTQQRITLHLTESDTTMALATWGKTRQGFHQTQAHTIKLSYCPCFTFDGLSGELVDLASGPDLRLVGNHVPQPLIVHHTDEDVRMHHSARHTTAITPNM
jgi:hypothetical protein